MKLNKIVFNFIIKKLDKLGVKYNLTKENKLIITDENNINYSITEYNYPHSLNVELTDLNNRIDEKYGLIFECEWSGTFSINLNKD